MTDPKADTAGKALIFNIQRYSTEDGPGVRTTVFFQGCPLKCLWCSNPESIKHKPQLLYFSNNCIQCYACLTACPNGANKKTEDGSVIVDRQLCTNCGACAQVCPADARSLAGTWMTVDEVFDIIMKDSLYYTNSGGGVTLGGGECTAQADFALELLDRCYQRAIHTCIDTCAHTPWHTLEKLLPKVELVLLDIKHLDPEKHKKLTGVDNQLILENIGKIKQLGTPIIIRLPLIPGYNDDAKNIKDTGRFMKLWGLDRVDILPYHRMGVSKYQAMGLKYPLPDLATPTKEQLQSTAKTLASFGLQVNLA